MNGMERFEQQLRETFRRVEPPPDLERRILGRVRRRPAWRLPGWAAVAACVLLVFGGSLAIMRWQQQRERDRQAELVREQLRITLQITTRTVAKAEGRLRSIGVDRIRLQEASWQER